MRKKIIAGNWKMNTTKQEAINLIELLKKNIDTDEKDVVLCVPFIHLNVVSDCIKNTNIKLGAQNMYFEDAGAFTGEISPKMLSEIGVKYVIIGHSERRQYFAETDETVNKKIKKAIETNITPIVCVGETLYEKENNLTFEVVRTQVKKAFLNVNANDVKNVVIAYEPIWAIGTGKTATKEEAQEVCKEIRNVIFEIYNKEVAENIRIQYGGSVTCDSAKDLFSMNDIDGALVGGASLKADFAKIVNF